MNRVVATVVGIAQSVMVMCCVMGMIWGGVPWGNIRGSAHCVMCGAVSHQSRAVMVVVSRDIHQVGVGL